MVEVAESAPEVPDAAPVDSSESPSDDKGEEAKTSTEQPVAAIEGPTEGSAEKHSSQDEKVNDASGDVVMEDNKDGETIQQPLNGTPASKKSNKRKSSSAIPEHKTKKLNRKKSTKDLQLHLDVEPGQYWFARMKGYPPWPCIICDEEMLPETLLKTRPVSAKRLDGSYRDDFTEGGKNARDRTYPVMFLGTNEFAWQVNTALEPLDIEKVKEETSEKKTKAYWEAFKVAMEEHDLQYFKDMLAEHESALKQDRKEKAEREAKKNSKKDSNRRKSKDKAAEGEDYDMDEDEGDEKAKDTNKRKKDIESDGELLKPTKMPKTKLKVNGPKPLQEESSSKKKDKSAKSRSSTSKAKGANDEETGEMRTAEKPLTETEIQEKRKKNVLFLRHKLQKGFLSRDQAPIESEMTTMSEHFNTLEQYSNLEAPIIRTTKINKVLKGIIKLNYIPKEEEFNFKKRSTDLLSVWNKVLNADDGPSAGGDVTATTEKRESTVNGTSHEKTSSDQQDKDETEERKDTEEQKDTDMETERKDDDNNSDNDKADSNGGDKEEVAQAGATNGTDSMEIDKAVEPEKGEEGQEEEAKNAEVPVASTENAKSVPEKKNERSEEKTEAATKEDEDTEMTT